MPRKRKKIDQNERIIQRLEVALEFFKENPDAPIPLKIQVLDNLVAYLTFVIDRMEKQ